jgi:hypothetical protein
MATAIAVVAVLVVIGLAVWFFMDRGPEKAAAHERPVEPESTSQRLYRGAERPAGPDAESQDVDEHESEPRSG